MSETDDQLRAPKRRGKDAPASVTLGSMSVGQKVGGEYEILREIGKGGMGMVYLAKDLTLGRRVAIKVINFPTNDAEKRASIIERFRREAVAAARIPSHPNVIVIHAFKEVDREHVQVMEYIDGRTLLQELKAQPQKALEPVRAARIVIEFLKGVSALHAAGVYHRDLKPANVMLRHDNDGVKILDLGLVKFAEGADLATDDTLTQCGVPMGSPSYMAPEQINALPEARDIGAQTDVYAVGVILFQLLTGKVPFDGLKKPIFDQHRFDPVPRMVSPHGELSEALQAIVQKAMAKKSSQRFASADAMRAALERLLQPPAPKRSLSATLGLALAGPLVVAAAALFLRFRPATGTQEAPAQQAADVARKETAPQAPAPKPTPPPIRDTSRIAVPPPVTLAEEEAPATSKAGCQAYEAGRTSEAETILKKVLSASPGDVDALYCLCGAYARQSGTSADERQVCDRFMARAPSGDARVRQVKMWQRRAAR
jgi:serine/threonine-protein kinase